MLIPRYWARVSSRATTPEGKAVSFFTWRGSRTSQSEAQSLAKDAADRIGGRIQRGEGFPERYSYGDRPLREEVIRELPGGGIETPEVAITRNVYGALVLNAARAFFIDVDLAEASEKRATREPSPGGPSATSPSFVWGILDGLLGRPASDALPGWLFSILQSFLGPRVSGAVAVQALPAPKAESAAVGAGAGGQGRSLSAAESTLLAPARQWAASHPGWSLRVYRTRAGLRYLVTHALFLPESDEVAAVMKSLGADPHYIHLCRIQKSFRARLTPKPWRIGMEKPPSRFPFESPQHERAAREWEARYATASSGHATCELIETIGSGQEHPEVAPIVRLHDEQAKATSGLPLA